MRNKVACGNRRCGWHGHNSDLLRAPNPFDPEDELVACPKCRDHESLYVACDAVGCWQEVTSGRPHNGRYWHTCSLHGQAIDKRQEADDA